MTGRGRERGKIVTALARELPGFMWAIAVHTEGQFKMTTKRLKVVKSRTTAVPITARAYEKENPRRKLCGTVFGPNPRY
jgi:hypothetical protein